MTLKTGKKAVISKIRPASWRVYVQGEDEARYVCQVLEKAGIDTGVLQSQMGLTDPPLFAVVVAAKAQVPLTQEELVAILKQDEGLELTFEAS